MVMRGHNTNAIPCIDCTTWALNLTLILTTTLTLSHYFNITSSCWRFSHSRSVTRRPGNWAHLLRGALEYEEHYCISRSSGHVWMCLSMSATITRPARTTFWRKFQCFAAVRNATTTGLSIGAHVWTGSSVQFTHPQWVFRFFEVSAIVQKWPPVFIEVATIATYQHHTNHHCPTLSTFKSRLQNHYLSSWLIEFSLQGVILC